MASSSRPSKSIRVRPRPAASPRSGRPSLRVPLLVAGMILSTSLAAWGLLDRRAATPVPPPTSSPAVQIAAGPWGTLELRDIVLDPRADYLQPSMCGDAAPTWRFPRQSAAAAAAIYDAAHLPPATRAALDGVTACSAAGCLARPPVALVAGLSVVERTSLYGALGRFEENAAQYQPMRRAPGELERLFGGAGLGASTLRRLRSLLYPSGRAEAFSDMEALCAHAADDAERRHILTTVVRERGVLATLRVPEGGSTEALARWWGVGRRAKDIRALLDSLARTRGGGTVDVMHLLPRFARARVNTFPEPDEPRYDCAYTALSFFLGSGDDRFLRPGEVKRALDTEYHPVDGSALQLGDVLVFTTPDGTLIHAVVHIAGDLVFTKNGIAFHKPWQLAHRSDLEAEYGNPSIYAYRKNDLGGS